MSFKFIDYTVTNPSAADATALTDRELDFGNVAPLGYKIVKFKIGNTGAGVTAVNLTATGTSYSCDEYIYENVYFSDDKIGGLGTKAQYTDILELDTSLSVRLEPNEISGIIWAIFACTPAYYGGSAEVIIKGTEI